MRKGTLVFLCGIVLVIVPYLGIPTDWKLLTSTFLGVVLILAGYGIRREQYLQTIEQEDGLRTEETFVETTYNLFK